MRMNTSANIIKVILNSYLVFGIFYDNFLQLGVTRCVVNNVSFLSVVFVKEIAPTFHIYYSTEIFRNICMKQLMIKKEDKD